MLPANSATQRQPPIPGLRFERRIKDPKSSVIPFHHPGSRQRDLNPRQVVYKTTTLPLSYVGRLHIILLTPSSVNISAGTLSLGTMIHKRIAVFPVTRRHFPRLLDLDLDLAVLPARTHIVVVLERNHTIVHFRVSRKLYQDLDRKPLSSIV